MEFKTDDMVLFITSEYLPHLIMGILLFGAAGFTRIRWVEGWKNWIGVFVQVNPSLQPGPSPIDRTLTGCGGLLAAILNAFLTIGFTIVAVDQLFFFGWLWEEVVMWGGGLFR